MQTRIQVKNEASSKINPPKPAVLFFQPCNSKPAKTLSPTTEQMQFLYKRTDATDTANDPPPMEQSLDKALCAGINEPSDTATWIPGSILASNASCFIQG